jgi:3,4-dihydroxy-9,10-secoandrosta-1,3,5(10)-triene-9,17-dione 4,5-dioxygenase
VSEFVTGNMGMGHVVVSSGKPEETYDLFVNHLGFYERNIMDMHGFKMWFLSPNERHHTLGIMPGAPGGLVHFMVEAASMDDVGLALDRVDQHGTPMMMTLGKHTNDHMISFYVFSPDGAAVEFGVGGVHIDGEEPTYAITAPSFWGHKFVGQLPAGMDEAPAH